VTRELFTDPAASGRMPGATATLVGAPKHLRWCSEIEGLEEWRTESLLRYLRYYPQLADMEIVYKDQGVFDCLAEPDRMTGVPEALRQRRGMLLRYYP
jgi:hypothetical protein